MILGDNNEVTAVTFTTCINVLLILKVYSCHWHDLRNKRTPFFMIIIDKESEVGI